MSDREKTLRAIGRDLDSCYIGIALTSGKTRRIYQRHRKACLAELRRMNVEDGLDKLSDAELLAELNA